MGVLAVVLTLAGCKTILNVDSEFDLPGGETKMFNIDPIRREQTIKVEVTSNDEPVSVVVILEKEKNSAKAPLAKLEKTKQGTLDATIPANEEAVVVVGGVPQGKKTHVKLTIRN
jgi:hypothetical protein